MTDLISRQEAIDAVCKYCEYYYNENVIQSIKEIPSAQPEKTQLSEEDATSDCISRQAALDKLRAMQTYKLFAGDDLLLIDQADAQTELMMLPSAQPTYTDVEIRKMQDLEQAQIEKAYQLGYEQGKRDAQPERKTGKWIPQDYNRRHGNISTTVYYYPTCSVCGCSGDYTDVFCKSCGAKMEG